MVPNGARCGPNKVKHDTPLQENFCHRGCFNQTYRFAFFRFVLITDVWRCQFTAWRRTARRNATTTGWVSQLFGSTGLEMLIWHILMSKVCNHKKECHCNPGWAPPYCNIQYSELPHGTFLKFYSLKLFVTSPPSYFATRSKPFNTEGRKKKCFWDQHYEIPRWNQGLLTCGTCAENCLFVLSMWHELVNKAILQQRERTFLPVWGGLNTILVQLFYNFSLLLSALTTKIKKLLWRKNKFKESKCEMHDWLKRKPPSRHSVNRSQISSIPQQRWSSSVPGQHVLTLTAWSHDTWSSHHTGLETERSLGFLLMMLLKLWGNGGSYNRFNS